MNRFFPSVSQRDELRRLFATRFADERRRCRLEAEDAASHVFSFFGRRFEYGPLVDWHADPVSGAPWPRVFHAEVPIGDNRRFGDVKYVWELNRHQFLIDLGRSYFIDDTGAHSEEVRRLLTHWSAENPYGVGVNWANALEPAFRAYSWLWAYYLTLDDPSLDPAVHASWFQGLYEHAAFLNGHLERYTSPYNHLAGEAAILYLLGELLPEIRQAETWRSRGREVLESVIGEQFHADGGSVEQSTFYHHATLGFYLLAVLIGRRNGAPFSSRVASAVERALEFSLHLTLPDGLTPSIGGADDGKPIRFEHLPFWDFRAYLSVGAVLYRRPDFKYAAGRFHEDSLWLMGVDGLEQFEGLASHPPAEVSKAFPASGYFSLRSEWAPNADYVCFDCGEQAGGLRTDAVPSAAHGHADCLSMVVALSGRPVLVDPGFLTYNGPREWEEHFRQTRAHNTATVDGRSQSRYLGKMEWSEIPRPIQDGWYVGQGQSWVAGMHDGYARGSEGVVHRRTAWLRPGGYVVVLDEFRATGSHDVWLTYQFAPGTAELRAPGRVTLGNGFELWWTSTAPLSPALSSGRDGEPDSGWIATSLGVRVAAPRLRLSGRIDGNAAVLTIAMDTARRGNRFHLFSPTSTKGVAPLAAAVVGGDFIDWIQAGPPARAGTGFTTDAPVAIWRIADGSVVEESSAGGTYMHADGDAAARVERLRTAPPAAVRSTR